jgi:Leishmanolysin
MAKAKAKYAIPLPGAPRRYTIALRFTGTMSTSQRRTVEAAKLRWEEIVTCGVSRARYGKDIINGLLILVHTKTIDGKGNTVARARPEWLVKRPFGIAVGAGLPALGKIIFDPSDLQRLEDHGLLYDTALHEIGHILGIGLLWKDKGLLQGTRDNPTFTGPAAMAEYGKLTGSNTGKPVPVHCKGGPFTRNCHWRESTFDNETMTPEGDRFMLLSRITVASLKDLGYEVNMDAAEAYDLP